MKRFLALLLVAVLAVTGMVACSDDNAEDDAAAAKAAADAAALVKSEGVMTYAEYAAAAVEAQVVIEGYVQGFQAYSAEYGNISLYMQDPDGAYFVYRMATTAEDAAKMVKGAKIKVTGFKAEWEGEVEITDATYEILEGTWTAEAMDATELLGTDDLIKHQNKLASFKGLTIDKISYKNDAPGDDIYVDVLKGDAKYSFCVESSLTASDTEVYKAFETLKAGDIVDIEGFIYWYQGVNTHITAIKVAQ